MKRCAVCHKDYDDAYDACPHCAGVKTRATQQSARLVLGCLGVFLLIGIALCGVVSLAPKVTDDQGLADQARAAITIVEPAGIDSVTAQSDGDVIVTLALTKEAIAGAAGDNGAMKVAGAIGEEVLQKVPAAKSVGVFDANNAMLELVTRKQ